MCICSLMGQRLSLVWNVGIENIDWVSTSRNADVLEVNCYVVLFLKEC